MSRTIPTRQALRQLARLCDAEIATTQPLRYNGRPSHGARPASCFQSLTLQASNPPHAQHQRRHQQRRQFHHTRNHNSKSPNQSTTTSSSSQPSNASSSTTSHTTPPLPDISTYYTLFPQTLPQGPPPQSPFPIPLPQLRKEFLQLQVLHHPDKYTTSPSAHQKSLALSALINQAYKTLSDPLLRAQYLLLQNYDIDVTSEDNSAHPTDQDTLMEVMDAQERVEEAGSQTEIDELKEENLKRIKDTEESLTEAFEGDDSEAAKNACVKMKYWRSLQQGLDDWEPGKEVRLIH